MKYLKKSAASIAAVMIAANSLGYMPYNPIELPAITANAAEIVASGDCGAEGDNVKWQLDSEGTLTISGTGEMSTTYFGEQELGKDENGIIPVDIKKVVIEDGVTSISGTAFNGYRMNEIEIADSVTSIGKFAFYNCPNLTEITLPKNLKEISLYAFTDCTALENITIPASVAVIGENPFYGCTSLNKIIVEDNNSDYVSVDGVLYTKDMTRIISYPIGKTLTEYNIPDTVKEIGGGAFGCETDLTNIIIPDSVTYIGEEAFSECKGITSITIPKNVANIGEYTFFKCAALEKIVIENPDCAIYDYSYTICNTAKSLTGTDSKYQGNYDGTIHGYENSTAQAYAEKYNRKFVALEEKPAAEIVASGDCGAEGDNVKWQLDSEGTLTISGTGAMKSWALNSPWSEYSANISKVIIEKGVTAIGEQAFSGCGKITEITIPDSVTNIKTGAFFECAGLTSIEIPESVTEIGHSVFYGCVNLKEITLPSGVETINSGVFRDCESLETITFSKNVTKVDFAALCNCSNLKSVTFENPECKIADAEYTICNSHDFDTKENVFSGEIHGYANSTAQAYAEKYSRKFIALDEKPATADLGDVNGNGSVDSSDASLVLAEYSKIQTGGAGEFTESQLKSADVNKDGVVDSADASKILAYYAMISTGKEPSWD